MADELLALDKALLGEVWTSEAAYVTLRDLCDTFGHRFAGSPGERGAAGYIVGRLRASGLEQVTDEPFHYTGWVRGTESLDLVAPVRQRLRCLALPYCPAGELEAELRWAGDGEPDDYARADAGEGNLRGTVVMTAAETAPRLGRAASHRREKYMRAVEAGAAAYLYVNQNPGDMPITGGLPSGGKGPAPIPGLGLTYETGDLLRRMLDRGRVRLRLKTEAAFPEVASSNIWAEIPADPSSPLRDQLVIAGGHYDSHDIAPGALDNGTGVACALEAARVLAAVARTRGRGFARTLRFCFFAAEEIGLLGSWEYVRRHAADLERLTFMLNLDVVGRGAPGGEALVVAGVPDLVPFFQAVSQAMGYSMETRDRFTSSSDHFPFAMHGIPSGSLSASQPSAAIAAQGLVGRGWGHTPADTVDKVNPRSLQSAAAVTARVLLRVAETSSWPVQRRTTAEVERQLAAAGLLDDLQRSGRWPPPR